MRVACAAKDKLNGESTVKYTTCGKGIAAVLLSSVALLPFLTATPAWAAPAEGPKQVACSSPRGLRDQRGWRRT